MAMTLMLWRLAALVLAALSLGPSFAHVLEAPPRLLKWSPELWREATVFNGQFQLFGKLGGPLDGGVVAATAVLAFLVRDQRPGFWFALAAAVLFAASLAAWLSIVAPANAVLATWKPGPIPPDFEAVRNRWETGHMVIAALKVVGFVALTLSVLLPERGRA
jgi:hypothetical protein